MADTQPQTSDTNKNPAGETLSRFNAWWTYAKQNHHSRWARNRKLYNSKRVNPSYMGLTDTFVPLTFSTVETIVAALGAGRPSTDFVPNDMYAYASMYAKTGKKPDLKALNAVYDYYWDCDNWDLKTIKTVRGALLEGIAGEWYYWDSDKPRILNLKARDIIVDPGLKDPMDLLNNPKGHFGGRRFLASIKSLKDEKIVDPKTGKLIRRYKNLNKITPGFAADKETDESRRDMFTGAVGADDNIVEVIEIWDGDNIRSIANRSDSFLIEDRHNDVGVIPLGLTRFIADEETIVGKSIVDPIADPQELLNDVTNQSVDAVTDILTPRWELDPTYSDQIGLVAESSFGTVFPFAPGSLKPIDKPVVTNGAFNERQNMKNEIREATGADQIVQGVREQGDGKATATEITAQVQQAGQRFELFVRMLEKEGFYQRAKIIFKLMRHYQKQIMMIPVMTVDGPGVHIFNPQEFDESYEPKIELQTTIDSKKQKNVDEYVKALQILIQDPTNDLYEAKKAIYPKIFDFDEEILDRIIGKSKEEMAEKMQQEQPPAPAPEQTPPSPTAVQMGSGQVHESADLVKLYAVVDDAGVRQQILEAMGFQPSGEQTSVNGEADLKKIFQGGGVNNMLPAGPQQPIQPEPQPAEVPA